MSVIHFSWVLGALFFMVRGERGNGGDPIDKLISESEKWPSCPRCGSVLDIIDHNCAQCGVENPKFDQQEFARQYGSFLEEIKAQEGCDLGHKERVRQNREIAGQYCIFCGRLISVQ